LCAGWLSTVIDGQLHSHLVLFHVRQEDNAADKFKEINKAYEALVDDEKRAR